ncbi:hypothetical protein BKA70DRAFT_1569596 [Coprinopsis sp. MPI-PUGE-AT-0042]|nr:hypothetical protein BKA70DRAFT_1569596 [Coprinopsis sp. MPI-PUGE-AT-0042]
MSLPAALEHLKIQRDSTSIVHMSNLDGGPPAGDRPRRRASNHVRAEERRPKLKTSHTTIMFRECEALEFNNCHFTCTGEHYYRSDAQNIHQKPPPLFPVSTPTPSSMVNHYRVATTALLAICLLLIMAYWIT